ncbi:proline-rich protein 2-like [Equus quagga]|uniref:proline-rich protein 2-like n=1 Tax=Equus quagga TaxID=89248 RepID=UPI001EE28100|nr:proline-rich protein 2-like [Equus quagga]
MAAARPRGDAHLRPSAGRTPPGPLSCPCRPLPTPALRKTESPPRAPGSTGRTRGRSSGASSCPAGPERSARAYRSRGAAGGQPRDPEAAAPAPSCAEPRPQGCSRPATPPAGASGPASAGSPESRSPGTADSARPPPRPLRPVREPRGPLLQTGKLRLGELEPHGRRARAGPHRRLTRGSALPRSSRPPAARRAVTEPRRGARRRQEGAAGLAPRRSSPGARGTETAPAEVPEAARTRGVPATHLWGPQRRSPQGPRPPFGFWAPKRRHQGIY